MTDPIFTLSAHDDGVARHCTAAVDLEALTVRLDWEEEPEDDDLDGGDAHAEVVVCDTLDEVQALLADLLRALVDRGYALFLDGHPAEVRPGVADLSMLADKYGTPWTLRGNALRSKVPLGALEAAYGTVLPEAIHAFFAGPAWRRWDRATALDLPGDPVGARFLGCTRPVRLDLLGPTLRASVDRYRLDGLCAIGKFVGQPEGLDYYGVVQADPRGRIWLTTRDEQPVPIAADLGGLTDLLSTPTRIASLS